MSSKREVSRLNNQVGGSKFKMSDVLYIHFRQNGQTVQWKVNVELKCAKNMDLIVRLSDLDYLTWKNMIFI